MARYTIDFTTNASKIVREIEQVNRKVAEVARTGKSVQIKLDAAPFRASLDATFRQLDNQIARMQRKLANLPIGSRKFQQQATGLGITEGIRQRGGMQASAIRLGAQAEAFDIGSVQRLQRQLEAARLEASQISPNTAEWMAFQKQIAQINVQLKASDRLAESVQMQESLGAFSPGSLNALEAKLVVLRNRARDISPSGETLREWKKLNNAILETERSIEKQTRRPLTGGQRLGAAGGAFLYGGGLGGGPGSALAGIAGGLMGGVPGAFTGAAIGQLADNLGAVASAVTESASKIQQLQRGLALASIDAKDFAEGQEAIVDSSNRLFVPLEQTYRQFTQLRVNTKQYGLSVKDTQEILEGTVLAISSMGGSMEDVDGAMRAVVQILSKGGVQAEELRGQLGERFPGAVIKFAQVNKLSFEQLQEELQKGEVGIGKFVKFAKENYQDYADFTEQIATAPEFAGRRLEKAMNDMQIAIGSALGPAGAEFQDFFAETITGFTKWVNDNKDYIKGYISDWTKFALDFARIVGGIADIVVQVGTTIAKTFRGVIFTIRNLLGMVGVAEIKAQIDKVDAQLLGSATGRRRRSLERRREQLQSEFSAAGGQAALDAATKEDFTYGGPGAGMGLDATGGTDKGKTKRERQLRDFASEAIAQLRLNQKLAQERLDQQRQLELIDETEYDIASASNKRKFELLIIEEALAGKRASIGDYEAGIRQKQLAVFEKLAANERQLVEEEYKTATKGAQLKISRPFKEGIKTENIEIEKQALLLRNLKAGYSELTPEQEANLIIEEKVKDLRMKQRELVKTEIENLRQVTFERIRGAQALAKEAELLKLRNQAAQLRAPLGQERLVELMQAPGYTPEQAKQQFSLEEQNKRLQTMRQGASDLAGTINSSIGDALTNIVTDFQNLQQHGMTFLQTLANGFKQLANTIIQEMTRAMISKAVSQLFSFAMPAIGNAGGGGGADLTAGIRQYAYANGGIAPGGFRAFASGGVVTGPTLGLVGEGRYNEAVVPLPDGKSIPVQLGGGAGGDISTNIVVNVSNGQASSQMSGNGGQALGRELEGAVRQVILKETRPGGLIYSAR